MCSRPGGVPHQAQNILGFLKCVSSSLHTMPALVGFLEGTRCAVEGGGPSLRTPHSSRAHAPGKGPFFQRPQEGSWSHLPSGGVAPTLRQPQGPCLPLCTAFRAQETF